jgi:type I restriction enzyme R subunit
MPGQYTEKAFEETIEHHLTTTGYGKANPGNFDTNWCLDPYVLLDFIQQTQPNEWQYLKKIRKEKAEETLVDDLCKALDSKYEGCLKVLRNGFKCCGKTFRIAFFAPASGLNTQSKKLYDANKLMVTRQLPYSKNHRNTLDLALSLNGIPIITAELKNPMTGQNWQNAIDQYRNDRNPKDKIFQFNKRTLVHFAVDPDEVHMTTRLAEKDTFFLPFNKGNNTGAGNPVNPNGCKTAYLWENVWQKDSLLDIIARFIHLQSTVKTIDGKRIKKETMIFPRYHQLDAVRKIIADARENGVGHNYLVQHSAGSGKSNSIAWLAHRLATLHNSSDQKIFDSVVVVTDRLVLDQQLQDTIYQFEHKQGVVQKIHDDSSQLANALKTNAPIIITTLQKFPYVTEKIGGLPAKNYAVIIDEAHSSQGGESAAEMKGVLSRAAIEEELKNQTTDNLPDYEEEILKTMAKRGRQPNISFFAFTATPKYKTLEVFGRPGPEDKPIPFHLYSMRQAIEERFILDVLQHYTTYKSYWEMVKAIEEHPSVDKRKATLALARFISLHPHNIAQKTEIMVEHFRTSIGHKIGGKAKGMVVAQSRLQAVRYKQTFDKYIAENGYRHIKTLVAFSGTVADPLLKDAEYTEVSMNNGIREKELPGKFSTSEYQILIAAEKYQTGFDQPLLHTMYVDKMLSGIQAVQTLSRLNRIHPGKTDTFVLDFVNQTEEILEAFKPYYQRTGVGEQVQPRQLYELQARLEDWQIFYKAEVEEFARTFYKPRRKQTTADHAKMNACIDPAVNRFIQREEEEEKEQFRKVSTAYKNLYAFMSQIIPFTDPDLEKLYAFIRFLLSKLPARQGSPSYNFDEEVALKYYRLEKIADDVSLELSGGVDIDGPTEVGTGSIEKEKIELSLLIDLLNQRFGTNFKPGDQLFFDSIKEDAAADAEIRQAALNNTEENFGYVFEKALKDFFIDRMDQNEDITARFMDEKEFQSEVIKYLQTEVYNQIRAEAGG